MYVSESLIHYDILGARIYDEITNESVIWHVSHVSLRTMVMVKLRTYTELNGINFLYHARIIYRHCKHEQKTDKNG